MDAISLLELNQLIGRLISVPATQNVWVTAELSDVSVRGGHCYMELLQKDDLGRQLAKARAVMWASTYSREVPRFMAETGQSFATGLKVMVRVSANMHPVYGMSLVVNEVNPEFSMGDLLRRRAQIVERLKQKGYLNLNRELQFPDFPARIAIISAPGAAGYGDFVNQLYSNESRLRFVSRLFPAIMQGERAPQSIISRLEYIADEHENWDCVVIIRGGGATSDLQAFEDYDLAERVACFPLPVIIGIGHERDITVLDYVANMRVKTPTAAAEWLIGRGESLLNRFNTAARNILQTATDLISGAKEHLGYCAGLLPVLPVNRLERASQNLAHASTRLAQVNATRIAPAFERLNMIASSLYPSASRALRTAATRLESTEQLVAALSPAAVLARGYSITRRNGAVVTSAESLSTGDILEITLAKGMLKAKLEE